MRTVLSQPSWCRSLEIDTGAYRTPRDSSAIRSYKNESFVRCSFTPIPGPALLHSVMLRVKYLLNPVRHHGCFRHVNDSMLRHHNRRWRKKARRGSSYTIWGQRWCREGGRGTQQRRKAALSRRRRFAKRCGLEFCVTHLMISFD